MDPGVRQDDYRPAFRQEDGSFAGTAICVCVTIATIAPSAFRIVVCHTDVVLPTWSGVLTAESTGPTPAAKKFVFDSIVPPPVARRTVRNGTDGPERIGERHDRTTVHAAVRVHVHRRDRHLADDFLRRERGHADPERLHHAAFHDRRGVRVEMGGIGLGDLTARLRSLFLIHSSAVRPNAPYATGKEVSEGTRPAATVQPQVMLGFPLFVYWSHAAIA